MIQIPTQDEIDDVRRQVVAICRYLKIKLVHGPCFDSDYSFHKHWPFEGGVPYEPLENKEEHAKIQKEIFNERGKTS